MSISVLFALLIPCSGFIRRTGISMNYDLKVFLNKQPKDNTYSYIKQSTLALPVWPVYGGVIAQLSDWILKKPSITDEILNKIGGRVVPMTLGNYDLSPFLLLAHHCHSFTPFDPIRSISNLVLSEGFPAHPHSGFSTVTYCIDGGLRHRDSEGTKMAYGNGDVQWMRAGRGTIHEEMWDTSTNQFQKIEIFQLWVNLPSHSKTLPPKVTRILSSEIPVFETNHGVLIKVISGSLELDNDDRTILNGPGNHETSSGVNIMHINIPCDESLSLDIPKNSNVAMYVRRGSILMNKSSTMITTDTNSNNYSNNDSNNNEIEELASCSLIQFIANRSQQQSVNQVQNSDKIAAKTVITTSTTTTTSRSGSASTLNIQATQHGADVLLLIGEPLNEPVVWQGPLVQSNMDSWQESANSFNSLGAGGYWDHKLTDNEWKSHIKKLALQQKIKDIRRDLPRTRNDDDE